MRVIERFLRTQLYQLQCDAQEKNGFLAGGRLVLRTFFGRGDAQYS